jgi:amidase
VGISFIGPAWSDAKLLALGSAFEKIAPVRKPPSFLPSIEVTPNVEKAFSSVGK